MCVGVRSDWRQIVAEWKGEMKQFLELTDEMSVSPEAVQSDSQVVSGI